MVIEVWASVFVAVTLMFTAMPATITVYATVPALNVGLRVPTLTAKPVRSALLFAPTVSARVYPVS
jgi:hypothetical protein